MDPIPRELARTVFLFSFHRYPLPHIMLGWFDHFPLATMLGDSLQVVNILFFLLFVAVLKNMKKKLQEEAREIDHSWAKDTHTCPLSI